MCRSEQICLLSVMLPVTYYHYLVLTPPKQYVLSVIVPKERQHHDLSLTFILSVAFYSCHKYSNLLLVSVISLTWYAYCFERNALRSVIDHVIVYFSHTVLVIILLLWKSMINEVVTQRHH